MGKNQLAKEKNPLKEGRHCPRPRRHQAACVVKCEADVEVDLNAKPRAFCKQVNRRDTSFDVNLDFQVDPRCKLRHKRTKQDGCNLRCVFEVDLDIDCRPAVVCTPCGKPSAEFHLDVEVPVDPVCRVKKSRHH